MVSADNDDRVRNRDQFLQRELSIFGWTTNRIDEAHFTIGTQSLNLRDQRAHVINRLGCLRNHSVALGNGKFANVFRALDDHSFGKIFGQSENFDVALLADDNRKISALNKSLDRKSTRLNSSHVCE